MGSFINWGLIFYFQRWFDQNVDPDARRFGKLNRGQYNRLLDYVVDNKGAKTLALRTVSSFHASG